MKILSPCKKKCKLKPGDNVCLGCYRTLDEIQRWSQMTEEEKAQVMVTIPKREKVIIDTNLLG